MSTHLRPWPGGVLRGPRPFLTAIGILPVVLFAGCDSGDGREMREPSVSFVAPTDPPSTTTP